MKINVSQEEIDSYKGNAATVTKYVTHVKQADIEKYLVRWELDAEQKKAYPDDEYENEDYQLIDFMRKLGLSYPITHDREPVGQVYGFWHTEGNDESGSNTLTEESNKPWWKFW